MSLSDDCRNDKDIGNDKDIRNDIKKRVLESLDLTRELSDEEIGVFLDKCILDDLDDERISLKEKIRLKKEIFNSIRRLDVITEFLEDDEITEIMVNGTKEIFIEKHGSIIRTDKKFESDERLMTVVRQIVSDCNRRINEAKPIVDARLSDGSRVNIVMQPISLDGPIVTIRKFPKQNIGIEKLIELKSIDKDVADFLECLVKAGYNIFISGGTGSGKTTFLNALSNYIPKSERIITIEDSAELRLEGIDNLVRLEARNANVEGENRVTIRDLIKTSLRMRPDRIVIGEIRDSAAIDLLAAMNTGHDGSLSTGHANSSYDMLSRLETMVLMGVDMPVSAIRMQIAAALDIIVHLGRLRDGSRRVLNISEVDKIIDGVITLNCLYQFEEKSFEKGHIAGELVKKGGLKNTGKLEAAGLYEKYIQKNM